ncbi:MAG: hypothetical protein JRK53_19760 [Deltaproteobacteria bacterium]|nr:hypothetical protein [Deltaproteobacteria bacterium]
MAEVWVLMNGIPWWHLPALAAIALLTRILPRLVLPDARDKDAYYHMLAARTIRKNRYRMPRTLDELILPGIYDYPPLFHYLMALFPEARHAAVERWAGAILDAALGLTVYLFSLYCLAGLGWEKEPATAALWISVLLLFSPSLTSVGTGPRAYQGTPRTLGELLFLLSMACSTVGALEGSVAFLIAAGVFGGLLMLTSKFGVQVFLLIHAVHLLILGSMVWLAVPVMSVIWALIFSWGHYGRVASGHWAHCRYYRRAISRRFYMVTGKNRWADVKAVIPNLIRAPKKAARTLLMDNTYFLLIIKNPQLFYVIWLYMSARPPGNPVSHLLATWVAGGLLAFCLTSLKPFLFLGEADRYLEYVLAPQFILIMGSGQAFPFAYFLLAYELVLYGVYVGIFVSHYSQAAGGQPEFREMVAFLKNEGRIHRILPLYLADALQLAYDAGKGVAHFPGNFRNAFFPFREFLDFYPIVYPFPNEDLEGLMARYEFDTVCFSEDDLVKAEAHGIVYDFRKFKILFMNTKYRVIAPTDAPADMQRAVNRYQS